MGRNICKWVKSFNTFFSVVSCHYIGCYYQLLAGERRTIVTILKILTSKRRHKGVKIH